MNRAILMCAALAAVVSCSGGNPFEEDTTDTTTGTTDTTDTGTGISSDRTLPPGTASPQTSSSIFRTEPTESAGGNQGDGYVTSVSYDSAADTFEVDNLAFDGGNVYSRGAAVSSLGPFAVYEAVQQFPDSVTGTPINQFTHRAIYGVSPSGNTQFAIVRTGAYINYGFGGFIYQREGGVTLPTSGQANYNGKVAGMRDFDGAGGLQYTTADIHVAIDFNDFNAGNGVQGQIYNREIFDVDGNQVTGNVLSTINNDETASLTAIPTINFTVNPAAMDENGEIIGDVTSYFTNDAGETVEYETGKYYAIVSGSGADEVVGVVVTTTQVGVPSGVTARETGGFIVYRN